MDTHTIALQMLRRGRDAGLIAAYLHLELTGTGATA